MVEITKVGFLPDISYNFGFYRTLAVNNLQRKDWRGASAGLYSLNGCLGNDYLVTISSKQYQQAIDTHDCFQCNYCTMQVDKIINKGQEDEYVKQLTVPTEVKISDVKFRDVYLSLIGSIVVQSNKMKVWTCPNCNNENKLSHTKKIITERESPFYTKTIYECPKISSSISTRMNFEVNFERWFWTFLEEINWQEVLYRKEYISQNGHDMEFSASNNGVSQWKS